MFDVAVGPDFEADFVISFEASGWLWDGWRSSLDSSAGGVSPMRMVRVGAGFDTERLGALIRHATDRPAA